MTQKTKQVVDFLFIGQDKEARTRDTILLKKAGFINVQYVQDGVEARSILKKSLVKFIVSELDMPHMSGIELLKMIRRNHVLMDLPFLLLSEISSKDMVMYTMEELSDGYLAMPFNGEDLLCSILQIKNKRKNRSSLQLAIHQARRLFLLRKYDKSIAATKEILANERKNTDALLILSESYYRKRKLEKAKLYLNKILNGNNIGNCKALHLMSKVCRLDADCGKSYTNLTLAYKQNPLNIELKIDIGKFYLDSEMDDKAQEIFQSIMEDSPTDLSLVKIGKALIKADKLDEAAAYLNKTVHPLPETVYVFEQFAEKLAMAGKHEESAQQYVKCLKIQENSEKFAIKLSKTYLQLDKKDTAKETLNIFLSEHPEGEEAARLLLTIK